MTGREREAVRDPGVLRAAVAELRVVQSLLSAGGDVAAEMPGVVSSSPEN
jgi:hypothetical protein